MAYLLPPIIPPMQQRLPLLRPTRRIARTAIRHDLANVPSHCFPALDLAGIFAESQLAIFAYRIGQPAAHIVPTIPLKPAARVVFVNPALFAPHRKRLRSQDAKVIYFFIAGALCKLGFDEPILRKFGRLFARKRRLGAVAHIHTAKDTEREHLLW